MSLIQKDYFRLDEVARELGLSGSDIIYLAENGRLRLSTLVYGLSIEKGYYEDLGEGNWQSIADDYDRWTGLLDLLNQDAHEILKTGSADVRSFHATEGRYCRCWGTTPAVTVTTLDLLVRLSERQRLVALVRQSLEPVNPEPYAVAGFTHEPDYRIVRLGGEIYSLGPYQGAVVKILHQAALAGRPWCRGVDILAEIECSTLRMSDLFKSKRGWRKLIDSNARGMYRLAVTAQN